MVALLLAIAITVSDQVSKELILGKLYLGEVIPVIDGFFNITYIRNRGAAWGMFGGQSILLTAVSFVALLVIILFGKRIFGAGMRSQLIVGLLAGGILGNLIDRIRLGAVTDFLDFYVGMYHWPAFNIADSSICIGMGIYVISSFMKDRRDAKSLPPTTHVQNGD